MALPGRTNELVRRIVAANPKTVVVNQSGSAVEMPWVDAVPSLLQAWYLGNSVGDAIADVLFGNVNPAARLSLTFPKTLRETPAFGNFGSHSGSTLYGEDLFVGYKHYVDRHITTLFPFGYGLSYTTFQYSNFTISSEKIVAGTTAKDISLTSSIAVTNTGSRAGSHVVQLYVAPPVHPLAEPQPSRSLRGFARIDNVAPGATGKATIVLDKYAFSAWEPDTITSPGQTAVGRWIVRKGAYGVQLAANAEDVVHTLIVNVEKDIFWTGL